MPTRIPAAVLRRDLGAIAASQAGYFTVDQALGAGYEDANFGHHLETGSWKRVTRGIYRLADWPNQRGDDLLFWHLWSKGQAVASHLSAIEHWGLGQLEADRPHLTVPRSFRRALPKQIRPAPVLHRRDLEWQRDVTFSDRGFKVTTVPRTIIDIAALVDADHLALTLQDAFSRGYLSPELLDHWMPQATLEGAATITRARAQLREGNVAVR
ncbi:MAG: type IV toxin-antitoxin system AbiEi family antitoxin domain-containing protein [Candidatus Dormibacteraceae bacterium]|jgi:predicted transcriptional regulator of viral defense system